MTAKPKNLNGSIASRAISIAPESFDSEARTVDIIYSTGAAVNRFGYIEELVVSEDAIITDRLDAGAVHLIRDHTPYGDPIGRVIAHRIENGNAIATVRLSESDKNADTVADIAAGVIRTVSVGYFIRSYEELVNDDVVTIRVTRWEPAEISLTVMPADPGAQVRSDADAFTAGIGESHGEDADAASEEAEAAQGDSTSVSDDPALCNTAGNATETETETETEEGIDEMTAEEIIAAERARAASINELATRHNLGADFAQTHIASGATVDAVRAAALDAIVERSSAAAPRAAATIQRDEQETALRSIEEALYSRMSGEDPSDRAREYRNLSTVELAREIAGPQSRGMSRSDAIGAAFAVRSGMHSTSDFAAILGNASNRTLRRAYDVAQRTFAAFVNEVEIPNFNFVERVAIGDAPVLVRKAEGEEYKFGSIGESAERYKLGTYGRKLGLSREMLINDDLGAFARILLSFARRAAEIEADLAYAPLVGDWKMSDGKSMFSASAKNLISDELNVDGLAKARAMMSKQVGVNGSKLNLQPAALIVGPDMQLAAERLLSPISAMRSDDVNVFAGSQMKLAVDGRIEGSSWFVSADPALIDTIELAYLAGERGLQSKVLDDEDRDGVVIKARIDCAAAPIDRRGFVKSTGTGA